MRTQLGTFEGRKVQAGSVKLSGSAETRVGTLDLDEEVYFVVKGTVSKVSHGDDTHSVFQRQHTVRASHVVLLDPADGERMLDEATMLADDRFGVENLFKQANSVIGHDENTGEITDGGESGPADS